METLGKEHFVSDAKLCLSDIVFKNQPNNTTKKKSNQQEEKHKKLTPQYKIRGNTIKKKIAKLHNYKLQGNSIDLTRFDFGNKKIRFCPIF